MASYTSNLNLKKPASTDSLLVADINNNMDTIDTAVSQRALSRNGSGVNPEFSTLRITGGASAGVDVIQWGGGQDYGATNNAGGILYSHSGRKYIFRSKGVNNVKNEDFELPSNSDENSNVVYNILTTKDYPLVRAIGSSPGGTTSGDGTNKITFTAPGNGRHAIICFAKEFAHVFCATASDSSLYCSDLPSGWTMTKASGTYTLTRTAITSFSYLILWL